MPGTNPLFIENTINRHGANAKGVVRNIPYPALSEWFGAVNANLCTISGVPPANGEGSDYIEANGVSGGRGHWYVGWQGTAAETNTVNTFITLDDEFCEDPKDFKWPFLVRKVGAGTDNTDLRITCLVKAMVPGDATERTVLAAADNYFVPGAKVSTLTFETWTMDIPALATATQLGYLRPRTVLSFTFAPQESVGTNLMLQIIPRHPIVRKHLVVASESDRKPLFV